MSLKSLHTALFAGLVLFSLLMLSVMIVIQRPIVNFVSDLGHRIDPPESDFQLVADALGVSYELAFFNIPPDDNTILTVNEVSHLSDVYHVINPLRYMACLLVILWLILYLFRRQLLLYFDLTQLNHWLFKIAVGFLTVCGLSLAFFDQFFAIFHQVLFPQGNFSFPADSLLIQAFPEFFWIMMLGLLPLPIIGFMGLLFWYKRSGDGHRR